MNILLQGRGGGSYINYWVSVMLVILPGNFNLAVKSTQNNCFFVGLFFGGWGGFVQGETNGVCKQKYNFTGNVYIM